MPASSPEEARSAQEAIAALALRPLRAAWSLWDPSALRESVPVFRDAVDAVTQHYGRAAAAQSLQHYRAVRADAGVSAPLSAPPVADVPAGFIDQAVVEALSAAEADIQKAIADLDASAEQLVLDQGRRQALTAVRADRFAKGWARVTNPGACSFCLMLAVRAGKGFLYTSVRSANFRAHPNCRCTAEPVFGQYEPTATVREAMKTWDEATAGRSGHDARVAFRQAIEGRPVTGSDRQSQSRKSTTQKRFQGGQKTVENQRHDLAIYEAMPPSPNPEAAKWRADRMAEIHKFLADHGE